MSSSTVKKDSVKTVQEPGSMHKILDTHISKNSTHESAEKVKDLRNEYRLFTDSMESTGKELHGEKHTGWLQTCS